MGVKLITDKANFGFSNVIGFQFGVGDESARYGIAFSPTDTEEAIAEALNNLAIAIRHKQPAFLRTDEEVRGWNAREETPA